MANYYRNRIEQKKRELEKKSGTSSQTSSAPKTLTSRDRIDKMRMESTIGFDTLQSDLDSLSSQYTSMYDGWQTQETMKNVASSMKAMQDRLNLITEYADKYGMDGVKDLDAFKNELKNYNNSYAQALDSIKGQSKVYGQYKDASSYTKDKTEIDKLNSMTTYEVASYLKGKNPIAYTTQTGQDITWQSLYDEKRHKDVLKSGKGKEGWDKYLSDKSAKEETKKKEEDDEKWYEWLGKTLGGVSDSTLPSSGLSQVVNEKRKDDSYMHPTDEWTEDEQNIFGAYYIENPEEAYKYATKVNNDKNKAKKNEQKGEVVDSATSSFGAGALHTAGSLATAPLGLADYLDDLTDSVAGRPILEGAYLSPFEYSQTVQGGIGEYLNEYGTIAEDVPVLGGAGLGDIYGLGTSMAQSILSAYTLGSVGMGISYFGQGSAAGVDEALEKGATDDEALLYGASVGVPEGALEALTGHLLKGVGKGGGSIAKDILGQGGEEAFEEGLTSIIGQIADNVILKDKSAFNNAVRKYISQGMTEEEANAKAKQDVVEGVAYDTLAGFLSGAGSAGILAPINSHAENKALGSAIRENQNIDELKGIAEELGGDAYTDYLNMLNGEKVSDAKVGKFYRQVEGDVTSGYETSRANDIMRTVADRAIELGDSKNSGMIASAVQKTIDGKKLSAEEKAIMKSDTAQVIMEDIKRGEIASKKSESFKSASDLKERTENLLIPTSKVKATGEKVSVEGVKKVDGETVIVTNNGEMSASDIDLAEHEAKLVDYTKGMNEEMANLFVSSYDGRSDIDSYKAQFDLAYSYGENEFGVSAILEKTRLNPSQASAIYTMAKDTKYATRQKAVNKLVKEHTSGKFVQGKVNESAIDYTNSGKGEVNWSDLSKAHQRHITFQNALYTGLGINVRWTTKGLEGNFNGQYSKDTNEITLDIYAGVNKNGKIKDADLAIMRTSSHEITHWMETKTPELYKGLKEHIFDSLKKVDGVDDATRIHAEMMSNPTVKTEEEAIAEIVARGCEDMLSMSDIGKEVLGKMTESEKKTFIDKVKEVFNDMIKFIDDLLGQFTSKSYEAQMLRANKESLEKQLALWEEALKNAVEVNQAMTEKGITDKNIIESVEKVGISIDAETNSAYPSEVFSRRTWEESDYAQNREVAVKNMAKALGVSQKKARTYIDNINSVARMIADDKARLDYEPNMDDSASVMKPNSDYKWSIDMSTLCAKRLLFTGTFDAIQRALPNKVFSSEDIVKLRKMMMDRAYEVACGICYVESTRREIGAITQQFIDNYKESQRTGKPITRTNSEGKVVDLKKTKEQMKTTADKSSDLFIADKDYTPTLADLNTTDIDIVKKEHPLVYEAYLNFMNARGQAKPKLLETRAEYKGEIAKKFKRLKNGNLNKSTITMNESGGLRLQSFSDFEVAHLIDMMQIVMDMSNVGLYSQAYTKVPAFAEVFGGTGVKINLSLIAKGNGLDADGNLIFDDVEGIDHKEAFRLREKYSKNVGTILVGKNDEHIIKAMADPRIDYIIPFHKSSWKESLYDALGLTGYDDYTDTQHEKAIDGRKISDFKPSEYWKYSKSGDENAKIYLEKCKKDGRIPKFPQFQGYEGYWKLLIDFKMYDNDGVGSPQTEVMPEFDMDSAMQILNDYEGGHRNLPVAKDVVEDFVSEYTQYSRRDSDGNYMTEAQAEFFKDSKVRDENGNLKVMYHGTERIGFTVFNSDYSDDGRSLFFTDSPTVAKSYSGTHSDYAPKKISSVEEANAEIEKDWNHDNYHIEQEGEDYVLYYESDEMERAKSLDEVFHAFKGGYGSDYGSSNYKVYLNLKNPLIIDAQNSNWDEIILPQSILNEINSWSDTDYDVGTTRQISVYAKHNGYDGVIFNNIIDNGLYASGMERFLTSTVAIAFDSNQIKSVANENPTEDADIRYSRRDSDYMDAVNRGDMVTAQKMVDEVAKANGYYTVVYHGTNAEKINVFVGSPNRMETNAPNLIKGYFSDQEAYSDGYGKNTFTYYINDDNFLEIRGMYDADEMTEYLERHGVTGVKYNDFISNEDEIIDWFDSWGGEYRDDVIDPWMFFNENGGNITERIHEAGYKGVWWYEGDFSLDGGVAYMPFESNLIKSADPVVYDDNGNVIPLSKRFNHADEDVRFARRRDNSYDVFTDKETRQKARELVKKKLNEHDERIAKKTTIDRIQKNTKLLTAYLEKPTKDKHIPMELIEPVRNLLISIDYATRNGGIDTSDQKDALAKVEKNVMEARKNVDLRANLTAFQMATSQDEMLQRAGVDFSGDIEALTKSLGNLDLKTDTVFVLKDMSLEDVARLDKIVRILKTVITRVNYYGTLKRKITISASAHELFDLFDSLGEVKEGKLDGVKDFFNYDNVTPIWFFDRLGDVGKELFQSFVKGQTRLAFNAEKAKEFAEGTKGKKGTKGAWTSEERKRWDEDLIEFEVVDAKKTRDITKPVMKKVYTTTSRLMTLYLHDQREQSRGHLYKGGGGRFTTFEHKGKTYGEDVNGVVLTPQLVKHMLTKLEPRAKEVADKISVYLNTVCKDLGNEVTRDLYDVELFLEQKYIPIEVIAESVSRRTDKSAPSITALLNKGFTKETKPNAKNQIVLDSIFDVYAKHTAEMITYNAYAREVYDAVRLFEYKENRQTYVFDGEEGQEVSDNIQTAMKGALGKGAVKYFRNFLEDVNGTQQAGRGNGLLGKAFSNSKLANVAWNMNVVLLQPFALIRSMITINPKYLAKGVFGIRSGMKSAMEHSGTALYKSFGYYDTDISLPFAEQIKNAETFGDKVKDWSMKGAEVMDKFTWGALWKACEYKVLAENKGLERGSDKFYDKVAEIFDETVYRTQVMDSTLSRSQIMRDKNDVMKGLTSFLAEPLLSYNTVYGVFSEWDQYSRQGHSVAECSKKCGKKLAVAIGAYCLGSLAEAGVRTLTSAMRNAGSDDEEDENVYLKELLNALNPLSKIPVLKEVVSALQGYGVSSIPGLNTIEAFVNAYNTICKIIVDGDEVSYKKVHKLLKAVSYASGHGISNAYRDIIAIWNSTIGQMYPSLIIKTDE